MRRLPAGLRAGRGARAALVVLVLALVAGAGAWSALRPSAGETPRGTVLLSTGQRTGVYYAWATTLAGEVQRAYPGVTVDVVESSGSVENIEEVALGIADVGMTTEDATEDPTASTGLARTVPPTGPAPTGPAPTAGPVPVGRGDLVALARVYDDYVHLIVRADSPVRELGDLRGRRVSVGQAGSGVALVARRVLEVAGIDDVRRQDLGLDDAMEALAARQVDAVFWSGGLPTSAVTDLARRVRLRLLPLDVVSEEMRRRWGVAYRPARIPAGSYGLTAPVATFASPNLLIARRDTDAAIVTALLDTMFRRREAIAAAVPAANALDRRTAISSGSLPLHPAAAAYFRRTKP